MTTDLAVVTFPLGSLRAVVEDGVVRAATFDATPHSKSVGIDGTCTPS